MNKINTITKSCYCGSHEFELLDDGPHKGIYCAKCGKWFKWANKEEINMFKMGAFKKPESKNNGLICKRDLINMIKSQYCEGCNSRQQIKCKNCKVADILDIIECMNPKS